MKTLLQLKQKTADFAQRPSATWWLAGLSAADASFSPLPPDPLLAALCYLYPINWQQFAIRTLVASLVGAVVGYGIGAVLGPVALDLLEQYLGLGDEIRLVAGYYQNNAVLAIFLAAFTPIPFKIFTVSAGVFNISLLLLIAVSLIGRGLRFGLVAYMSARFGELGLRRLRQSIAIFTAISLVVLLFYILN